MKQASKWCDDMIGAFTSFIKWLNKNNRGWKDYIIPDWVIAALSHLKMVVKVIKATLILMISVFAEMSIFDPSLPASILEWAGFTSAADWFRKQPKYGLNLWSRALEKAGNYKGAMTTVPYDCRGSVWTWEEIVEKFKKEEKYMNRDSASERRIWEKWTEDNWRPDPILGDFAAMAWHGMQLDIEDFPELEQELKEIAGDTGVLRDCYYWSRAFNSEDEGIKNITITIMNHIDTKYE